MTPLISINNLNMSYGPKKVLKDVSFEVHKQDFLTIIGENGSGKSTLIKGLLGLKSIDAGDIKYQGIERNQIGSLPQDTQIQHDFPANVKEIVLSGCVNQLGTGFFYKVKHKQRMLEQMRRLEIEDLANSYYQDLSIGQRQRVLLARALCATSNLLILDEPVTSLDPQITNSFYELLKDLNRKHGLTVIMITHDIGQVADAANKVLLLNGSVLYFGEASDYIRHSDKGNHQHA